MSGLIEPDHGRATRGESGKIVELENRLPLVLVSETLHPCHLLVASQRIREGKGWVPAAAHQEARRAAKLLEAKIRESGISIRAVEAALGWSHATLNHVFSGRIPLRFSHVAAVCAAINLPLEDFYRELAEERRNGESLPVVAHEETRSAVSVPTMGGSSEEPAIPPSPAVERGGAEEVWTALERFPMPPAARSVVTRCRQETAKLERALALLDRAPLGVEDVNSPKSQVEELQGWPLCEALLQKSYELRFRDLKQMLSLAESAVKVAEMIRPERYSWPGFVADLRARALAELGNAYRVNDRFAEAESALGQAREFLEEGTGDPFLRARVLDLLASLRSSQRRLEEALFLLEQVHDLYLAVGDPHLAGRALISMGASTSLIGYPREAVGLFEKALGLLIPGRDPQLVAIGQQGFLDALTDSGDYRHAGKFLVNTGLREAFVAEPLNLLRLRWIEGKIHLGLGRFALAEQAFDEVRKEFLERGHAYDAALAGLNLAALWLRQGRVAQVRELAEEIHATFEKLGVEREATRALDFMREACRRETATVPMIEGVRTFLERLPWQPGLRFEPAPFAP